MFSKLLHLRIYKSISPFALHSKIVINININIDINIVSLFSLGFISLLLIAVKVVVVNLVFDVEIDFGYMDRKNSKINES
jgi:hypothetical protein